MQEWLLSNREWVFSGAGIFAITVIFSILSAMITLYLKRRYQSKLRKKLQVVTNIVQFDLSADESGIDNESLLVSYKSKEYRNLCYYSVKVTNIGASAINNQSLLFTIPKIAQVIESSVQPSNSSISVMRKINDDTQDEVHSIDRLENSESVSITYLVNLEKVDEMKCIPRGIDNIDYSYDNKQSTTNDTELLVMFIAVFIFVDIVPVIGSALQGLIVFVSAPLIVRIVRTLLVNRGSIRNSVNITGGISMKERANLIIDQKN
ncbi:hypothetical protein CZ809_02067 [Photobacterium piscicola]|uniref:Uncharacterized protein n=1 Tax=Photobacterium piscicola TaxID=1378299 RepID=A0A1T5I0F6_9GAMM|nr:hypothetical protein [Photobacterium piscicola]SKC32551.1 hypothetical protein CZ809_02067 [Photobacterium piscicola]